MNIEYDWTDAPHVDFLGQRIEFTNAADSKLKGIVARLERTLPRELAKLNLRAAHTMPWDKAIEYERDLQAICFATEDAKEGRAAFAEKRAPVFRRR